MNKVILKLLTTLLITMATQVTAEEGWDVIRITNGEWPPYFSQQLKHGGATSHLVTEAFALQGVKVEYGWLPWIRSLQYAQSGQWHGSIGWKNTPERAKTLLFSEPIAQVRPVFFHLKSIDFEWRTPEDLIDKTIGGVIGYDYGTGFTRAESSRKLAVKRLTNEVQLFRVLLAGRIDIMISNELVGHSILAKHFSPAQVTKITHHHLPVYEHSLHLALSKKIKNNNQLLKKFNKGLQQLKSSGRYEEIYNNLRTGQYEIKTE